MDTPTNNQTELYPDQHPPRGCTPSTNPRTAHQRIILLHNVTADLLREAKPLMVWTLEGQKHLALFLCPWLSGTLFSLMTPQKPSSGGCSSWPEWFPRSRWQNNSGSACGGNVPGDELELCIWGVPFRGRAHREVHITEDSKGHLRIYLLMPNPHFRY